MYSQIADRIPFERWAADNLKVTDGMMLAGGGIVPLDLNPAQFLVDDTLTKYQWNRGLAVRALVLKARRVGISTWTEARFFREINRLSNHYASVCSADIDATDKVFKMAKLFQELIPANIKRETEYSSRKEITYKAPHRSSFQCQTAGKDVLGRGGLTHLLHCTEFAFWSNAKDQLGGALQEVPDEPDTMVIIESTANGVGDAFYDMYMDAIDRWRRTKDPSNFLPIFLPWFIFPKYRRPLPGGFTLDEEELSIKAEHDLGDDQMAWRRWAIVNKCQDDLALFRQEYPATALEAFQASGRPVFTPKMISTQKTFAAAEPRCCVLAKNKIEDVNRSFNCWQLAALPNASHSYAMGIDTMEGRISDVQDEKSKLDCDAALIFDRTSGEFVAMWHGRGPQKDVGLQCLHAAKFYNDAFVAPEIPAAMELLNIFREAGYQNIYNRQVHDEQIATQESENLGWRTTLVTRKWLVDSFITALRDLAIKVIFGPLIEQMETFIRDKTGKPIHMAGKKDDLLFAAMIALQVHLRCPLTAPITQTVVGEFGFKPPSTIASLAYSGAIDPGLEGEEVEDDNYTG